MRRIVSMAIAAIAVVLVLAGRPFLPTNASNVISIEVDHSDMDQMSALGHVVIRETRDGLRVPVVQDDEERLRAVADVVSEDLAMRASGEDRRSDSAASDLLLDMIDGPIAYEAPSSDLTLVFKKSAKFQGHSAEIFVARRDVQSGRVPYCRAYASDAQLMDLPNTSHADRVEFGAFNLPYTTPVNTYSVACIEYDSNRDVAVVVLMQSGPDLELIEEVVGRVSLDK